LAFGPYKKNISMIDLGSQTLKQSEKLKFEACKPPGTFNSINETIGMDT